MKLSWQGANRLLLLCSIQLFIAEGHFSAFTPLVLRDIGLSEAEVAVWTGLLVATTTAVGLILSPFWGVLAERYSRRLIIVRGYLVTTVALLMTAWAPNLPVLLVSRVVLALGYGNIGVSIGLQASITPPQRLSRAIAAVQAASPVAASLGPPVGALLIPHLGLRGLFVLDAAQVLIAAIALVLLLDDPRERVKRGSVLGRTGEVLGVVWTNQPLRWNFISSLLQRGGTSVAESYLPVRITQLAESPAAAAAAIGWILGLFGLVTGATTWAVGRVLERVEPTVLFWRVTLLGSLVTLGMALAPSLWLLGLLSMLRSIPVAFGNTILYMHQAKVLAPELQTAIFSLSPLPRNLGSLLFPLLAASVAAVAPGAALATSSFSYLMATFAGLRIQRLTRRGGVVDSG